MMKSKITIILVCSLFMAALVSGCMGGGDSKKVEETTPPSPVGTASGTPSPSESATPDLVEFSSDPVNLTYYYPYGEEGFNEYFKKPVESKLPHITLNYVEALNEEEISQGIVPDITYHEGIGRIEGFLTTKKLNFDLQPFVDKYGIDLNKIQPNILNDIRLREGKLYVMPLLMIPHALHYNKDIFDKLGVEYPKDGMTWDEVIELAKQVTRNEGGVQYRGLDFDYPFSMLGQFPFKVPEKQEPTFTNINQELYQKWLEKVKAILEIPGNYPDNPDERSGKMLMWGNAFLNEKNVAMYPYWDFTRNLADAEQQGAGFNWDIVTFPQLAEYPGTQPTPYTHVLSISPVSKAPDAAFQVLSYLISDEYQVLMSKNGWGAPILTDSAVTDVYSSEKPGFQGKNIRALFELPPPPPADKMPVQNYEFDVMWNGMYEFARLEKDINTILTKWQDQAEQKIQENAGK